MFNSDYPTEKIVYLHEGTLVCPSEWTTKYDLINTHIKSLVYLEGDFSVAGSNIRYPMQDMFTGTGVRGYAGSFMYNGECWVAPMIFNFDAGNEGKVISYRIWAYASESDSKNTDIGPTANMAKPVLTLNSDENYPRFVGDVAIPPGSAYTHNLGYIPLIKTWGVFLDEQIKLPDGTVITADYYERLGGGLFGSSGNDAGDFTVSKTQIKSYGSSLDRGNYYCRMYIL